MNNGLQIDGDKNNNWPGRISRDYDVIDWNADLVDVCDEINQPNAKVAMTFLHGVKIAISEASPVQLMPTSQQQVHAGTVIEPVDGPFIVRVANGWVLISKYAFEGTIDNWHFENAFGEFLVDSESVFRDVPLTFTAVRFPAFSDVLNRFSVLLRLDNRSSSHTVSTPTAHNLVMQAMELFGANHNWMAHLFKRLDLASGKRFLDIGCGGVWTGLAARSAGLEAWACDLDSPSYYSSVGDWFHYFRADAADFPSLPVEVDFIFCRNLTPLAWTRSFNYHELSSFRDKLLAGLSSGGAFYITLMSNNTGIRVSENDFGNTTIENLHEWIGQYFPYVEYAKSTYISLLASRRPLNPIWSSALELLPELKVCDNPQSAAMHWRRLTKKLNGSDKYYRVILKLSQYFWARTNIHSGGDIFIMGGEQEAEDLEKIIRRVHRTFNILGCATELPAGLPDNCYIYCMPDCAWPEGLEQGARGVDITYQELLFRVITGDYYSVGEDHDLAAIRDFLVSPMVAPIDPISIKVSGVEQGPLLAMEEEIARPKAFSPMSTQFVSEVIKKYLGKL